MLSSQFSFDLSQLPEESTSSGVNWLCHPTAMQSYLSLLGLSQKDATLEASCGALQNLTASKDLVSNQIPEIEAEGSICLLSLVFTQGSSAMSQILVHKLGALAHISPLLKFPNSTLQKSAMALLGNMSRSSGLQTTMGKEGTFDILELVVCRYKSCNYSYADLVVCSQRSRSSLISPACSPRAPGKWETPMKP